MAGSGWRVAGGVADLSIQTRDQSLQRLHCFDDCNLNARSITRTAIPESFREGDMRVDFIERTASLMQEVAVVASRSPAAAFGDIARN